MNSLLDPVSKYPALYPSDTLPLPETLCPSLLDLWSPFQAPIVTVTAAPEPLIAVTVARYCR
jgi:hypothetical protein